MPNRRDFLTVAAGVAAGAELLGAQAASAQPAPSSDHTEFVLSPSAEPYQLFSQWLQAAKDGQEANPTAMTLATVDADGLPDARMMLHQDVRDGAFLFTSFSNSTKGRELKANPKAALVFYWSKSGRMVRVRGGVRQMPDAEADALYDQRRAARPLRLRDLAWPQSETFEAAEELEKKLAEADRRYGPAPPRRDWTGYLVAPVSIEFFQPHPKTMLHERLRFSRKSAKAAWTAQRIVP